MPCLCGRNPDFGSGGLAHCLLCLLQFQNLINSGTVLIYAPDLLPMNTYIPHKRYPATAFHGEDRLFGEILLHTDSLIFASGGNSVSLPLHGLNIKAGGANDRMLFFTHASEAEWTVCSGDHGILNDPVLADSDSLRAQTALIHKAQKKSWQILALIILLTAGGIYGLFMLRNPLVKAIAEKIPPIWEEKLGEGVFTQLKAGQRFIDDREVKDMLARITEPLLSQIPRKSYSFQVHIADNGEINAYALPGGIIVINTGLILQAESPEQIAGVLAHEVAHVTLQHGLRQMISSAGIIVLLQAFFGDVSGITAVLAEGSAFLLTRKYSREFEREADERGWQYLTSARIDPRGMSGFFQMLVRKQEEGKVGKTLSSLEDSLNFLSTHPSGRERIEHLAEMWESAEQTDDFMPLDLNLSAFQKKVAGMKNQ